MNLYHKRHKGSYIEIQLHQQLLSIHQQGKEINIMIIPEIVSAANSFLTPIIYDLLNCLTYPLLSFIQFQSSSMYIREKIDWMQKELQIVYKDYPSEKLKKYI
ncbi:unnamed protein product [Paramecium sonneborni]|uniref:Uncharacterized protein n=1 Tax=Paramecium sonneborni TaxID=65129 RepID=A0A8S1PRT8_9CILI|nr:unnamed protein product [Paramecium sonneborni]